MIHDGRVLGLPLVDYTDTKSNIEALPSLEAGMTAFASDTGQFGYYDGTDWQWFNAPDGYLTEAEHTAIGDNSPHHAPVTLGTGSDPALSLSGQELTLADVLTPSEHSAIGNSSPHHAPITLDADAETILDVTGQEIGLDTQAVGTVLAGPLSGAADEPTFKHIVHPMIADGVGRQLFTASDGLLLLGPGCPCAPTAWRTLRGQTATLVGAFNRVPGRWPGTQALRFEPAATNYAKNPRPDNSGAAWPAYNGTHAYVQADGIPVGTTVGQIAAGASSANYKIGCAVDVPVLIGEIWTITFWARATMQDSTSVYWQRYGPPNDALSSYSSSIIITPQWQKFTRSVTITQNGNGQLVLTAIDSGNTVQVANVNVEKSAYGTSYLDGDLGYGYAWTGTPHASTSTRAASYASLDAHAGILSGLNTVTHSLRVQASYAAGSTWPTDTAYIFDLRGDDDNNRLALLFDPTSDSFRVYINGAYRITATGQTFAAMDWLHLVLTVNYTTDVYTLYLNGVVIGSDTTSLSAPSGLAYWVLGALYDGSAGQSGWAFAEYAVLDRALSAEEVAALYASDKPLADAGAFTLPVNNLGPLDARWPVATGTFTHTGDTSYAEAGSNVESRFGWGTWVSGKLQFEAVLQISNAAYTGYAKLQWDNSGTWIDVPGSEVSVSGTTNATLVRSGVIYLSPGERTYRVAIKTSNSGETVTLYKASLICTPGGLSTL